MNHNLVLVVDDDPSLRRVMRMQLNEAGYEVLLAATAEDACRVMDEQHPKLVISDLNMSPMDGIGLLRFVRDRHLDTTVIIITAFGSVETAVQAMREGAYDYVTKPIDYDALVMVVHRAMERQKLREEVRTLRSALDQRYGFEAIIGRSKPLLRVLELASRVAQRDSTVLIQGETGTGKELLARAIHHNSHRQNAPFVTINCATIPKDLIESELFGYQRGAFTGAHVSKAGKVELASGGTLFLDEVGELPLDVQSKLLRLLQEGEIAKLGTTTTTGLRVDIRVIAATNRDLSAMVDDGTFREDLYYRLAVVPLHLPPLRERREDIPELAQHLFTKLKERYGLPGLKLTSGVLRRLLNYSWPGNIRELENVIERMVVLAAGDEISEADLPDDIGASAPAPSDSLVLHLPERGMSLESVEREILLRSLEKFNWNQTQTARFLDISRRTLIYRMEKHGLRRETDAASPT
jgi:DNA-binding NtrC family response regulator